MLPEVMLAVTGCEFKTGKACLQNYQRFQVKNKVYPAIVYSAGNITEGVIYFDIDEESLQRLDYFEDIIYHRKHVSLISEESQSVEAFAYIINPEFESSLSDKEWILEDFRERCLENYVRRCASWMQDFSE